MAFKLYAEHCEVLTIANNLLFISQNGIYLSQSNYSYP